MSRGEKYYTKRMLVRVTDRVDNDFREYCNANGFTISKRIRLLIMKDMEGKLVINK